MSGNIIVVMNQKGGVGKSTVATNIAVESTLAGYNACIIDADPNRKQGTKSWIHKRVNGKYDFAQIESRECYGDIFDTVQARAREHDIVIVDCGGLDSTESASACATAHLALVPIECDIFDEQGELLGFSSDPISEMDNMLSRMKAGNRTLKTATILNKYPTSSFAKNGVLTRKYLTERTKNLRPLKQALKHSNEFSKAAAYGAGVSEMGSSPSAGQVQLVFKEIVELLNEE